MNLIKTFEERINHHTRSQNTSTNKAEVRPVEIASAIQQEIKEIQFRQSSKQSKITPNQFSIDLSPHDFKHLSSHTNILKTELGIFIRQYSNQENLLLVGNPLITLHQDNNLSTGIFRITARMLRKQKTQRQSPQHSVNAYLIINGTNYNIEKDPCIIGRSKQADIQINDARISRKHALLGSTPKPFVRDLRSTNGTFINKIQISECPLENNTKIQLGSTTITYKVDNNE